MQGSSGDTDIENRLVDTHGGQGGRGRKGGTNRESNTETYILAYAK